MRRMVALLGAVALSLALTLPADAITDGELDGGRHPYVGLLTLQDANGKYLWRCSGTLLSSRLFLTAGHCTEAPAAHAELFFADGPIEWDPAFSLVDRLCTSSVEAYPCHGDASGTLYTHPQYDPNAFFLYDLGVVVLDKPLKMKTYGILPSLNQLDAFSASTDTVFTAVGYGLQKAFPDATYWKEEANRVRMLAYPNLLQINTGLTGDGSLILSNNPNTGGTCFGDSGGPNFIGYTNVVGGVTSFAMNNTCGGTGGVYRVDRADDLNWLYGTFAKYLPRH
jgi:hypothetical protein